MKYCEVEPYVAAMLATEDIEIKPAYGHAEFDDKFNCIALLKGGEKDFADYVAFDIDVMLRTSVESDPDRADLFAKTDALQDKVMRTQWNISAVTTAFESDEGWHGAILNFKLHERFDA